MDNVAKDANSPTSFELKGAMFAMAVLRLFRDDVGETARELKGIVRRAPDFFRDAPVVIDLQFMDGAEIPDFVGLAAALREHGLIPIGIRNGTDRQRTAAVAAGLPVMRTAKAVRPRPRQETTVEAPVPQVSVGAPAPKVVTRPIRSGQQVYAAGRDLVVLASVNPGAEVLADGSIHVYGPLRGRALAGVTGQTGAWIFCRSLEAELVSIAGHYRVLEESEPMYDGRPVQVYLAENRLMIEPL